MASSESEPKATLSPQVVQQQLLLLDNFEKEYNQLDSQYKARNLFIPVLMADAFMLMHSKSPEDRQYMLKYWKYLKETIDNMA